MWRIMNAAAGAYCERIGPAFRNRLSRDAEPQFPGRPRRAPALATHFIQ